MFGEHPVQRGPGTADGVCDCESIEIAIVQVAGDKAPGGDEQAVPRVSRLFSSAQII